MREKIQEFESWQKITFVAFISIIILYIVTVANGGTEYPEYVRENREPVLRAVCKR